MAKRIHKRNLIVSYNNLSDELKELFKTIYPDGYRDHLQRTEKPNGDVIFCAPMETEDTVYMVKFEVKIDTGLVEADLDRDIYGDDKDGDDDFAPISEAMDKDEGLEQGVGELRNGDYENFLNDSSAKKEFALAAADIAAELGKDDDDDFDSYDDDEEDDDDESNDEPNDDDLMDLDLDNLIGDAMVLENGLLVEAPQKPKRGRPAKPKAEKAPKDTKSAKEPKAAKATKEPKATKVKKEPKTPKATKKK